MRSRTSSASCGAERQPGAVRPRPNRGQCIGVAVDRAKRRTNGTDVSCQTFRSRVLVPELVMSRMRIHFAAVTLFCLFGIPAAVLVQNSGSASGSSAPGATSPAGTPSAPGPGSPASNAGIGPAPAPTPGQSITIQPNTPSTSQGIGPAPAPTPGQSVSIPAPSRRIESEALNEKARPVQPPRQSRMRSARTPRQLPTTVGSGSQLEHPAQPDCFRTPNIVNGAGGGLKQGAVPTPPLSSQTGRPSAGARPRC